MKPVKWGIISTANIGRQRVIPPMQKTDLCDVIAVSSRNLDAAKAYADELGIPKAYGSYEEMLADPEIEAVYNPLPNHLHVPLTIQAAEAGKHVLCEKPIAMTADEAKQLIAVRDKTGVLIQEAFMVRHHPQWIRVRNLVRSGRIGDLRAFQMFFSYTNTDPNNVRNIAEIGGWRPLRYWLLRPSSWRAICLGRNPPASVSLIERDPDFKNGSAGIRYSGLPAGSGRFHHLDTNRALSGHPDRRHQRPDRSGNPGQRTLVRRDTHLD